MLAIEGGIVSEVLGGCLISTIMDSLKHSLWKCMKLTQKLDDRD